MGETSSSIAAFILAGGKSTRMGRDKAFVEFEGQTLLSRALLIARALTSDVWIIGDAAKFAAVAPVVEDVFQGCGPLGGIHAALRASTAELNLMLAVDMPFIPADLLGFLVARACESTAIVTVPRVGDRWQPLCAVYRRKFADVAENALHSGRYKIDALFEASSTQVISEDEFMSAGFSVEMFRNLNTPEELAEAGVDYGLAKS